MRELRVSIVLRLGDLEKETEPMLFRNEDSKPHRWFGFVASLLIHALTVAMLPAIDSSRGPTWKSALWSRYEVRPIRLRLPEPLYAPSLALHAVFPKRTPTLRPAAPAQPAPMRHGRLNRRLTEFPDLPNIPERIGVSSTVLQLDAIPGRTLQAPLPDLTIWSSEAAPRRPERAFAMPKGKAHANPGTAALPAVPAAPAMQVLAAGRMELTPALPRWKFAMPAATVHASEPAPVGLPDLGPTTGAGDAAHVIAVSAIPAPPTEFLTVPPVLQKRMSEGVNRPAAPGSNAAARANDNHAQGGTVEGRSNRPDSASAATNPPNANAGFGIAGTGSPDASKKAQWSTEPGAHGGNVAIPVAKLPHTASTASDTSAIPPELARRIDRAQNGRFGYTVLGAPSEAYPESAGILSGKLVYTVYLKVDTNKDWILQYCLTPEKAAVAHGSIDAPYPVTMYRPNLTLPTDSDAVMVRGRVSAAGRLDAVLVLPGSGLTDTALLVRCLREWNFRPASVSGEPTDVEILLIIPPEGL